MYFYIIEKLKLIVGWNNKAGCTTIKTLLLQKLGYKIKGNVHLDMLTDFNLKNGKYDIFLLNKSKFNKIDLNNYTKVCIVRNPYKRLISGIRQRSIWLYKKSNDPKFKKLNLSKNTITIFLQNLKKHHYIESHFRKQAPIPPYNNIKFDKIIDLEEIEKFYNILELPYTNNYKAGSHSTKYIKDDEINYYNLTIKDIKDNAQNKWSENIHSWFTKNDIELINDLYKADFIFLKKNGFDYKI